MMKQNDYIEKKEYEKLKKEKDALEKKISKLDKRLHSIMKMNDTTFKTIFNKNSSLEKNLYRFDRILQQSDRQGKSILVQKEAQEQMLFQQARLALMGEMIDNIAHQWRQPLNNISAMIQTVCLKFLQNKVDETVIEKFQTDTLKQIIYMSDTIDDFRGFLQDNKDIKEFSLAQTFKKVETLTKTVIDSNSIDLDITIDNDIEIYGSENELIQVILNLISNSNDLFFQMDNSKQRTIKITVKTIDTDVIITFLDNAGGVPKKIIKSIFDFRFTTKEEQGGTGIGLYMSRKIMEESFLGTIHVQNETFEYDGIKQQGALFTLNISKNPQK